MSYRVIGPSSTDTTLASTTTVLRYDSIGTGNAVKLLPRLDSWNGYIKLYSELDSHFEINDLIYISFSGDSSYFFSNEFIYGQDQFTLDNEILSNYDINYPYVSILNGYKVLYINQNENSFVIDKFISDAPPNSLLYNHYASKVRCEDLEIYEGSIDSSFIYSGTINIPSGSDSAIDWIQGVMLGGNIYNMTLDDKYLVNYITMLCSYNSTTNDIAKNINLNNNGEGYSYFYNLNNSIYNSTISSGNYYNCSVSATTSATTINNGYFNNCSIYSYSIDNGILEDCSIYNVVWNYAIWRNVQQNLPFPKLIWYDGIFDSGIFNGTVWYNGILNSGIFSARTWVNGTANGGTFDNSTTFYNCTFNDGLIKNANWKNGIFNGGIIECSNWYNGQFNNGSITSCTWFDGIFYYGTFNDGYWLKGEFYDGNLLNSYILRGNFYGGIVQDSNIYNATIRGASMSNVNFYKGSIKDTLRTQNSNIYSGSTFAGEVIIKPHMITNTGTSEIETFVKFEFPYNNNFESPRDKGMYISGFGFRIAELDTTIQIQDRGDIPDPVMGGGINYMIKPNYVVTKIGYNSAWFNLRGIILASGIKRSNRIEIENGTFSKCIIANADIYNGTYNNAMIKYDTNWYGGNFNGDTFNSSGGTENNWWGGNFYNGTFGYKTEPDTIFADVISESTSLSLSAKTVSIDAYTKPDGTKDPSVLIFELQHIIGINHVADGTVYFSQMMQNLQSTPDIKLSSPIGWQYGQETLVTEGGTVDFNGWCMLPNYYIQETSNTTCISYVTKIPVPDVVGDILVSFTVSRWTQGRLHVYLGQGDPVLYNIGGGSVVANHTLGNNVLSSNGYYNVWVSNVTGGTLSFISIDETPYPLLPPTVPTRNGFLGKITNLTYKVGKFNNISINEGNTVPTFNTNYTGTTRIDMEFVKIGNNVDGLVGWSLSTPNMSPPDPPPIGWPNFPCEWRGSNVFDYHFNRSDYPNLHHNEAIGNNIGKLINLDCYSNYSDSGSTPPAAISFGYGAGRSTLQPWYYSCSSSYLNFSGPQYSLYPAFNGKSWQIVHDSLGYGRLQIAFKFPIIEKYLNQPSYPSNFSKDGWPKRYSSAEWYNYWRDLYTYGWYIDRYIVTPSTVSSPTTINYYTDWIVLPGLYKLPTTSVSIFTVYASLVSLLLTYKLPMVQSKIKDNWLAGSYYNGMFEGKWYDYYTGKTFWRGGKWDNAWNGLLQNNLEPTTVINVTNSNALYNQDNANLLATGRYVENPPWVQKNQNYQNIVNPPTSKNKN